MKRQTFVPGFPGFYNSVYGDDAHGDDAHGDDVNWGKVFHNISRMHVEAFVDLVSGYLPRDIRAQIPKHPRFELISPKEYNFETDRLKVSLPEEVFEYIYMHTDKEALARVVTERHASHSGFISFYPDDLAQWPDIKEWDANQLETLLMAWDETMGIGFDEVEYSVIESHDWWKIYE